MSSLSLMVRVPKNIIGGTLSLEEKPQRMRIIIFGICCQIFLAIVILCANPAQADDKKIEFNIPQSKADRALTLFAQQADVQILYPYEDIKDEKIKGISGRYSSEKALDILLKGTCLKVLKKKQHDTRRKNNIESHMGIVIMKKNNCSKNILKSLISTGAILFGYGAVGQDINRENTVTSIEEIIVTARRREESIQDVPVAVTAFSGKLLKDMNVTHIENLGQVVPGLTVSTSANRRTVPAFAIRGQRNDAAFISNDPSVGIYIAEAPQVRVFGLAQSMYDLESVQVLKGPQGTLFGRNTTGGAILIQPKRPELNEYSGYIETRLGNLDRTDFQGAVSIPLGDKNAIRVSMNKTKRDGYVKDVNLRQDLSDENTVSGRAILYSEVTENINNTLYLDYFDADQTGSGTKLTAVNPNSNAERLYNLSEVLTSQTQLLNFHETENSFRTGSTGKNVGVSTVTEWNLANDLLLKNIFSYRDIEMEEIQDLDGTVFPVVEVAYERQTNKQLSEEVQIQGNAFNDNMKWVIGAFYFEEEGDRETLVRAFGNTPNPRYGNAVNKSSSIYSQIDYGITEFLEITVGLRYTRDKREFEQNLYSAATGACLLCAARKKDYSDTTYNVSLKWNLSDDKMLYASTRKGYRAGGFDSSANTQGALEPFDPEEVIDYEVGFKGDWLLQRSTLRANIAGYYTDYKDIQRATIGQVGGVPVTSIFNAAEASIKGAEIEINYKTSRVELIGTAAWTDAEYKKFITEAAGGPIDNSDNKFAWIPELTYRLGVRFHLASSANGIGDVYIRGDYSWQDEIYHSEFNDPRNHQDSYEILSSRLDFEGFLSEKIDLGIWGRNLTNEKYFISSGDQFGSTGIVVRGPSEPRTWGVDLRYSF